MITVGIIKEKYYDNETLIYKVDLPIFKSPGVTETPLTTTIIEATVSVAPGTYEPYNIEDQVYIGFVNNELGQPVILGKIAKKYNEKIESSALNKINSLEVTNNVVLPKNITLGEFNYKDLYNTITYVKLNEGNEEGGSSYTAGDGIDITNNEISVKLYQHNIELNRSGYDYHCPITIINTNSTAFTKTTFVAWLVAKGFSVSNTFKASGYIWYDINTQYQVKGVYPTNNNSDIAIQYCSARGGSAFVSNSAIDVSDTPIAI